MNELLLRSPRGIAHLQINDVSESCAISYSIIPWNRFNSTEPHGQRGERPPVWQTFSGFKCINRTRRPISFILWTPCPSNLTQATGRSSNPQENISKDRQSLERILQHNLPLPRNIQNDKQFHWTFNHWGRTQLHLVVKFINTTITPNTRNTEQDDVPR